MSKSHRQRLSFGRKYLGGRASFYQSMADYKSILQMSLAQLSKMGFILRSIDSLKQKHVEKLIQHWQENKLSAGTIKTVFLC